MKIENVSQATFDKLRQQLLSANKTQVSGTTSGVIIGHGVTANYKFDPEARTLEVDVVHHPFFIPVSAIESQLRSAVTAASA